MKKILCLLCSVLMVVGATACGSKPETDKKVPVTNSTEGANKNSKSESIAKSFIQMILDGDFSNATEYYDLDAHSVIDDEDIKWAITRGEYAELMDSGYEIKDCITNQSKTTCSVAVLLSDKNDPVTEYSKTVYMQLNNDNAWKINAPEEFVKYKIMIPRGTKLSVKNKPIAIKSASDDEDGDVYEITCVAKTTPFKIDTTDQGTFEKEILPCNLDEPERYHLNISDTKTAKTLLKQTQSDLNQITAKYIAKKLDRASMSAYFSEDKTADDFDAILKQLADAEKASTGTFTAITLSNIMRAPETMIYMLTDDIITINFNVTVTKPHSISHLGVQSFTSYQWIRFKRQSDKSWKICDQSESLFNFGRYAKAKQVAGAIGPDCVYDGTFEPVAG